MKSILSLIAASTVFAVAQQQYTVTDLGTLGGSGTSSNPYGLNAIGWVAGSSNLVAGGPQHSFYWFGFGPLMDLGTLGGKKCTTCNSQANGMNAFGQIAVGSETANTDPNGEDFCGYGTHRQCLGAIGSFFGLAALPALAGGNNANALGVNLQGQAVGLSEIGTRDSTCASGGTAFQVLRFEAATWGPGGRIQELHPLPNDTVGFATGVNSSGQAVGASGLCSNTAFVTPFGPFAPHAVMWDSNGAATDLGHMPGTPAGIYNIATSINDRGEVVGFACVGADTNPATCVEDAFLWTKDTGMQDLGGLPGAIASGPPCCNTINNSGVIVGISIAADYTETAVIWQNKVAIDLNTLIPKNSGWYLVCAQGINDAGEIIGFGTINGSTHAFRATPKY
jgi:probable HAF family extracellular repeat protein